MYLPLQFKEDRPDVLLAVLRRAPLATLVIATEGGLEANPVPLLVREREGGLSLVGHVARSNPVWKLSPKGEVLALFSGPEGYISPSSYASKQLDGKVVPTWNYVAVHAHGSLRWVHDDEWLATLLEQLTHEHEAPRAEPWRVSDAPEAFTAGLRRAIVGLEIEVSRLEGKLKLGQNRTRADREGAIAELRARGDDG
ncbi:MAG TPA: FMN-binding negative transcriptional regulator, partial [Polyangiaceae bacterium]|nr:FMN-binding negative transcriptional regulator [Polyangiaceae bacterium]